MGTLLPQSNPWLVLIIEPLHGLTFAIMWLCAVDFGRQYAPEDAKTRFQALTNGTYFQMSFGVGSFVWGPVMQTVGYHNGYRLCGCMVICWSLLWNTLQWALVPRESIALSENLLPSS